MNKYFVLLALAITMVSAAHENNWAVLVAGSKSYSNYRHQSDVFHAYHILKNKGIPEENIIVFAYDDIANSKSNPFPGKVFNKPNGDDVYEGVLIDYKGADVTPDNFIKVITGDKEGMAEIGTGKVLESTEKDNVFIYFSDHGADNLIAFPTSYLYADKFNAAIKTMHEKKLYNKLVLYIEACHSGSMFDKELSADLNVYATTAANPNESSYAYYCGSEAVVNGTRINSCLGDEYSVKWMEHTESLEDLKAVTLQAQYELVKSKTTGSHVMQYGDLTIAQESLAEYQGHSTVMDYFLGWLGEEPTPMDNKEYKRVKNTDMKLYYLKERAESTNDVEAYNEYLEEVKMSARSATIFNLFKQEFDLPEERVSNDIDYDCYRQSVAWYEKLCGMDIDRDHSYLTYFASFCTLKLSSWKVYHALNGICAAL